MTTTTRHDPRDCATCAVTVVSPRLRLTPAGRIAVAFLVSCAFWGVFVIAPLWWRFR